MYSLLRRHETFDVIAICLVVSLSACIFTSCDGSVEFAAEATRSVRNVNQTEIGSVAGASTETKEKKPSQRSQILKVFSIVAPIFIFLAGCCWCGPWDIFLTSGVDRCVSTFRQWRTNAAVQNSDEEITPPPPTIYPPSGIVVHPIKPSRSSAPYEMIAVERPEGVEAGAEMCTICLSDVWERAAVMLQCGHRFHRKCVKSWLEKAVEARCPVCQMPVAQVEGEG